MTESGYFAIIIRISLADGAGFGSSRGSFSWEPAYCKRQKLWAATSAVRDAENKVTVHRPYSAKFDLQAICCEACYCERSEQ